MRDNIVVNYMLDQGALVPEKAHEADAGFDIKTPKFFVLEAHKAVVIDTGVHLEIPNGYVGVLISKSGLNVRDGITSTGCIDSGYTGSIKVKLYNNSIYDKAFDVGDKITQIVFLPLPNVELKSSNSFAHTERGDNGFGSTGR